MMAILIFLRKGDDMAEKYKSLTNFLPQIKDIEYGKWKPEKPIGDGSTEHPFQLPHVVYAEVVDMLVKEIYSFEKDHPEYGLNRYDQILEKNKIDWDGKAMADADVTHLDGQGVMALLMAAIRAERFCDGALLRFFEMGCIQRWLKRLVELDKE